jgi:hypothetical protein
VTKGHRVPSVVPVWCFTSDSLPDTSVHNLGCWNRSEGLCQDLVQQSLLFSS